MRNLITSESVGFGHPDKIADQISDALLDLYLERDPDAKVAIETMVKDNHVILGGEVTLMGNNPSFEDISDVIKSIYYDLNFSDIHNLHPENIDIINFIGHQSLEINKGITSGEELGAGDQGFMVGYATNETSTFMPLGMFVSKYVLDEVLDENGLGPDMKAQVTIEDDGNSMKLHTLLVSTMHDSNISLYDAREIIGDRINDILYGKIQEYVDCDNVNILINPAGTWNVGGPVSDCGLTGRKIVVDQYGSYCPVGGGSFSGKDSSKVDRSGAYLARYIAKNLVNAGWFKECKVQIAYIIGLAEPTSLRVEGLTPSGEYKVANEEELKFIGDKFPMTPNDIIEYFGLKEPIFYDTARFGHFGNSIFPWEKLITI